MAGRYSAGEREPRRAGGRLVVEQLEERIAPAGGITAVRAGGNLIITGDDLGNDFAIDQAGLAAGQFRITSGADATTINGVAGPEVFSDITNDIKITLNGGDDIVLVDSVETARHIWIDGGEGNNSVTLDNSCHVGGNLTIRNLDGNDTIDVDAVVMGNVMMDNRAGSSVTGFSGLAAKNLTIKNGVGNQDISIAADITRNVLVVNGAGVTEAAITGAIQGNLTMRNSDGTDQVFIDGLTLDGALRINYGNGYASTDIADSTLRKSVNIVNKDGDAVFHTDTVTILGNVALNNGNDVGWTGLENTSIAGNISIRNGEGDDTLTLTSSDVWGLNVRNGNGASYTGLAGSTAQRGVKVTNGTGFDQAVFDDADVTGSVVINNGEGDSETYVINASRLGLGGTPAKSRDLRVKCGTGDDAFIMSGGSAAARDIVLDFGSGGSVATFISSGAVRDLRIKAKDGVDSITAMELILGRNMTVDTGEGADMVVIDDSHIAGATSIRTGGGDDIAAIEFDVDAAGAPAYFDGKFTLITGDGDDSVVIGVAGEAESSAEFAGQVILDGGAGDDTINYLTNGNTFLFTPKVINMETET